MHIIFKIVENKHVIKCNSTTRRLLQWQKTKTTQTKTLIQTTATQTT